MTRDEVEVSVYNGDVIKCVSADYPNVRRYLHEIAGMMIDNNDSIRAMIALNEVRRLDGIFDPIMETQSDKEQNNETK